MEVGREECVTDDLDVLLLVVEVLLVERAHDVGAEGGIDEDGLVELADVVAGGEGPDGLEHAERVAPLEELAEVALVEGARDDEDDVVDHVPVGDVVEEGRERLDGVELHVLELVHHLLDALLLDGRGLDRRGLVLQDVPVLGLGKVELHVLERLALAEVGVVVHVEELGAEPAQDGLEVPVLTVEGEEPGVGRGFEKPVDNGCHFLFLSLSLFV